MAKKIIVAFTEQEAFDLILLMQKLESFESLMYGMEKGSCNSIYEKLYPAYIKVADLKEKEGVKSEV